MTESSEPRVDQRNTTTRGFPFLNLLTLGVCLNVLCGLVVSGECPVVPAAGSPITVRVYNRSSAPDREIDEMEKVGGEVFQRAKVTTIWVPCAISDTSSKLPESIECQKVCEPGVVSLTLINDFPALAHILGASTLHAGRATLYYERVRALAPRSGNKVTAGQVLGYAAAHELGHLMLGSRWHSAKGVMKETWSSSDLFEMAVHQFWFMGGFNHTPKVARRAGK